MPPKSSPSRRSPTRHIWSFFSGAGGLDLGLEAEGLHPTLAVDIDPTCCETLSRNRPNLKVLCKSISDLSGDLLRAETKVTSDVFLMAGGPPCQSFSPGGKRAALSDPRGNLIYEYLRLISEVRPRYFIFENVGNLLTAALRHRPIHERPGKHWSLKSYDDHRFGAEEGVLPLAPDERSGSAIRQLLKDIEELHYSVAFGVLDAADYGAPQHRLRFLMVGSRDGEVGTLPPPTHGHGVDRLPFVTVRDAIFDLRTNPGPHSSYTDEVRKYFEMVPPGGNWRHLPKEIQRAAMGGSYEAGGGKTGFFRRLSWDAPSPTVTGRSNRKGSSACHPEATRPLSVRECARLQGFPDSWELAGSMSQQYLQAGNAVPVPLARVPARAIVSLAGRPQRKLSGHAATLETLENMLSTAVLRLRSAARNKASRRVQPSLFPDDS